MRRKDERSHETQKQKRVRIPVRAQREAGNSKTFKRGLARKPEKLGALIRERDELQEIELDRLLDAAIASGILERRFTKAEMTAFLKSFQSKDSRPSKSTQLTNRLEAMSMRQAQNDRKLDTRQKILLGAFLMDLLNEDKDARDSLIPKLETFIKRGSTSQADRNAQTIKPLIDSWSERSERA